MKDAKDKATGDLLRATDRRARYADKQRALGRTQCGIWMTQTEREAVEQLLAQMRGEDVPRAD